MPRTSYADFKLKRVVSKPCKAGSGMEGVREYACFACPHCGDEVDVVNELISSKKGAACSAHLKRCAAFQAKQALEADEAPASVSAHSNEEVLALMRKMHEAIDAVH